MIFFAQKEQLVITRMEMKVLAHKSYAFFTLHSHAFTLSPRAQTMDKKDAEGSMVVLGVWRFLMSEVPL